LCIMGCKGDAGDTDDSDNDDGACGEVTHWDVTVLGQVVDGDDVPVESAHVELVDQGWEPGTVLGEATADMSGAFTLQAEQVTSVVDCWGTMLDYRLTAEEGGRTGEKSVNSYLFDAIDSQSLEADISAFPVIIE
jgi:hypothetical protein